MSLGPAVNSPARQGERVEVGEEGRKSGGGRDRQRRIINMDQFVTRKG